ncbi:MAG TPA: RuvX/YqgF family protein [Candidatus Paceibacterota bacterium]
MKYIGIDFGTTRIGIAISDMDEKIAFPRGTLLNDTNVFSKVVALVAEEHVGAIVVGDTLTLEGRANSVTPAVESFIKELAAIARVPVLSASEAWTTVEAARYAPKGSEHDDSAAAAVILQRFLDSRGGVQ